MTYLLDLDIHLSYSLPPGMYIIRTTQLIDLVTQERRDTDWRSRMAGVESSQSIPFSYDRREICRELLKVQLLLIAELDYGLVRLRVLYK